MDLSKMTLVQLKELSQKIPAEIKRREAQEKVTVLNELKEMAQKRGFSLDQLLGKEAKVRGPKTGRKVAVKYRHPKDAALQWTGRGRQPKWVQDWLGNGGKLDKLKV
ncbi:MAG TPA: H-NS histone family protein [Rhodocyclaceae bacterium]|nr:H-NS histone family protein [Rhodocyclaceae bacterium]